MNIPQCKLCEKYFDGTKHYPLILPKCGHTLCRFCINDILEQNGQKVFECPFDQTC